MQANKIAQFVYSWS